MRVVQGKKVVEVATYLVVLSIGIVSLYSRVHVYWHERYGYVRPGGKITGIPGSPWEGHDKTLILVLRVGCHFCEVSMPFYRQLSSLHDVQHDRWAMMAVYPDDRFSASKGMELAGIHMPLISGVRLGEVKIRGTPTLIALNRSGTVVRTWVGSLTPEKEAEVITYLGP